MKMKSIKESKKSMTNEEYRLFIKRLLKINEKEGSLPESIDIDGVTVYKKEYIETIEQVNKFVLENGRQPQTVTIKRKSQH